ncbi:ABC transporter permease [Paracoccus laeviglucosivorans]|uniref:Osmoprotectant transport system permease protein n=1 Tax=Paracoccus laeviglucosivorans TaxID=1197861 RepID=A0A521FG56_9RHOB|nr:ABC transporter permease [Paracoccus laeviglucosivorans]SMO94974.1 osmoprotectant transport system permease protein [Paracoccus laeviglucosivorans]
MSPPAILVAILGLVGLWLPLVQFKPNRIAAGDSLTLAAALEAGWPVALGLAAVLILGCLRYWSPRLRIVAAALGIAVLVLSLGAAASQLVGPDNKLARVSPASGFWLMLLAFSLMWADGVTRMRPSLRASWLMLAGALAQVAALLLSGQLADVSVMRELAARQDTFAHEARAHLILAFGSLGLALLAGLPLGIAIYQAPRWRGPVLAVLNVLQTIPSLALFGIMIPILGWIAATLPGAGRLGVSGIGMFPALVALFLYSLLPVVSNTLSGLAGVPATARDAAAGLGMTRAQMMFQILLPLGLPALLAAVRIVLVQNIGLTVIAGLIGGGGFGTFVFQGLNQTAMDLVLLGALPTIALALVSGIVMGLLVDQSRATRGQA